MKTREYVNGRWVTVDDRFRSYSDPAQSSADYLALLRRPRYSRVLQAPDLAGAIDAVGASGYATDPAYTAKLNAIEPKTSAQQGFYQARKAELLAAGADPVRAELGARQSALETGWGRSAPGSNFYGIKAPDVRQASATGGLSTDTDRTPSGDPRTGRMNTMLPPFTMPPPEPETAPEADWTTPIVSLLAGLAMGRGEGLDRVLSGAALAGTGLAANAQAENELLELKRKREDAMRKRQGQDALDRYADLLSQNPETAEIGAMMRVDPGTGMEYYARQRLEQQSAAQREAMAQEYEVTTNDPAGAARIRAGYSPGAAQDATPKSGLTPRLFQVDTPTGTKTFERIYSDDGTYTDRETPGIPIQYDPETARMLATSKGFGEGEAKALPVLAQSYTDISVAHDETARLLADFEDGKYAGDTGPLIGRIKQLWDPDVAVLRASATGQQLQNLQIVNLAPVTERELALIGTLGPNPDYTSPQNIAVLKRLVEIQATKKALLKKAMSRINKEGYEAYIRNPVTVEEAKEAAPNRQAVPPNSTGWKIEKE